MIPVAASLTTEQYNSSATSKKADEYAIEVGTSPEMHKECQSRHEILKELEDLGVNSEELASVSIDSLAGLLKGLHALIDAHSEQHRRRPGRPKRSESDMPVLTKSDKTILHHLFSSQGHVSSLKLSRELDIPLSTIQRRRKRLQDGLLETHYSLRIEKLGWRSATLLISTTNRAIESIGTEILGMSDLVSSVSRAMGGSNFDLRVEVVFKTNADLMTLIDRIKLTEGVSGIIWSESLKLIGKKDTNDKIINST
jgi:DNA-binding Lrp family transcriptional regulator